MEFSVPPPSIMPPNPNNLCTPPTDLNGTLGALFIGNIVGGIFYGITTIQTFIYFRGKPRDCPSFRLLICFLWILDSTQMGFMTRGVYHYLVLNFSNRAALLDAPWTLLMQVIVTCLSDLIVRCIFARRIWLLSGRNKLLLFIIVVVSVLVFGIGIAFTVRGIVDVSFIKLLDQSWLIYTAFGSSVFVDVLIAGSLCVLLHRSRSGFKSTDSLVNTLMLYSINTGLLTSIAAMACFVTFAIWPHTFIFIGIFFVLGKLYINSILAVLNTRKFLRKRNSGVTTIPRSPSAIEPLVFGTPTMSESHGIIESSQPMRLSFQ